MTDTLDFVDAVAGLPEQLTAAHEAAGAVPADRFPRGDAFDAVVVVGMGGSGIAGDVLAAVGTPELPIPVVTWKHCGLPAWVGPRTLVFALSYSGETEETVGNARQAVERGSTVVAVSEGGALAALARDAGALHLPCPSGFLPRAALGALVAPVLVTCFRAGLLPSAHASLVAAQEQLARRRDRCAPSIAAPANPARELARRIGTTVPLVYGAGPVGAVAAYRWKCDVNENAKAPAFAHWYPELDHNEICAWGQHGDVTRQLVTLVELRHGYEHPQDARRVRATRDLVEEAVHQVLEVEAVGEGALAQLLDLMYVGDWVSTYLALDHDVDPGPIAAIADLKAILAGG